MFVLERVDTMDDPAANTLLKTLEEPPGYVVLILLTDKPDAGAADDHLALPGRALRPAAAARSSPSGWSRAASRPSAARACARLSLGDGERALALALGDGPGAARPRRGVRPRRARGEVGQRQAVDRGAGRRPHRRRTPPRPSSSRRSPTELEYLPKKEHRRKQTEFTERARRAARRAETGALDHALQLVGPVVPRPRLPGRRRRGARARHRPARGAARRRRRRRLHALHAALELVEDTRARLPFNVCYDLALQALAYRLERTLAGAPVPA